MILIKFVRIIRYIFALDLVARRHTKIEPCNFHLAEFHFFCDVFKLYFNTASNF